VKKIEFKIPPHVFDAVYRMPAWQKALIFAASWTIPLALFWFLFLSAKLGELDTISDRIPKLRQEVRQLEAKKSQLPKLEKELKELQKLLKKALNLLPEKEDIPAVLTEISSLGNEARLEFHSFQPQKEILKDFYAEIPVSLQFSGPFHNTLVFFDKISKMARIVHIRDISMGGAKESAGIYSQLASQATEPQGSSSNSSPAPSSGADMAKTEIERGSSWVINTKCTAVTYRFLTADEIKAKQKKKQKSHKKRRRKR